MSDAILIQALAEVMPGGFFYEADKAQGRTRLTGLLADASVQPLDTNVFLFQGPISVAIATDGNGTALRARISDGYLSSWQVTRPTAQALLDSAAVPA